MGFVVNYDKYVVLCESNLSKTNGFSSQREATTNKIGSGGNECFFKQKKWEFVAPAACFLSILPFLLLEKHSGMGVAYAPWFFLAYAPGFFSLMHPNIFSSVWNVTKHWEFSCNGGSHFFSPVHPGALFTRFGVAFAPFPFAVAWHGANFWTSLASTQVWSLWSDLRHAFRARSQHLSQVTSKTLRLLLWSIFLEYIRCYVVTSFSSKLHNACDAMLQNLSQVTSAMLSMLCGSILPE